MFPYILYICQAQMYDDRTCVLDLRYIYISHQFVFVSHNNLDSGSHTRNTVDEPSCGLCPMQVGLNKKKIYYYIV